LSYSRKNTSCKDAAQPLLQSYPKASCPFKGCIPRGAYKGRLQLALRLHPLSAPTL